jgi:hypothetical protein
MNNSFNNDTIDGFKAFILCGGSRDQVVREMSEYIYLECEWKTNYDRSELLETLINLVYDT